MYSDNNKSQGSVATHLRCGALALLQNFRSDCWWQNFLNWYTFGEVTQNGLIASHALFEVHCPAYRCRFRQITYVWWTTAVIHCCYFRLSLFSDINVSQGCVATFVRCHGGIFNANFIANCLTSQPVNEIWKSVDIWRSYRKSKKMCVFWDTVYITYRKAARKGPSHSHRG